MKRLLRVSLDSFIYSVITTSIWFVLSFFVEKNLINIFVLTYPIYYISCSLKAIFGTGANISKTKGNINDVLSGLTLELIFSIVIFGFILMNIQSYINLMGIDVSKVFVAYSIIEIFLHTILNIINTKLYYENKNELANKYSLIFYLINFICILVTAIFFKEAYSIVIPTIVCLSIFIIYLLVKTYKKFHLSFNLWKWIKYDSVALTSNLFLGIAYFFGISIAFNYGENYALAMTFVALITDTQWDVITTSISEVAKIDISKNDFNYKYHLKNAYKLVMLIVMSIIIMFVALYNFYDLKLSITLIFLGLHLFDFIIYPVYTLQTAYLQLEYSIIKTNANNLISKVLRLFLSFLKTPFCNVIAQTVGSTYQLITMNIIFRKNYKINENGSINKK